MPLCYTMRNGLGGLGGGPEFMKTMIKIKAGLHFRGWSMICAHILQSTILGFRGGL